MRPTNTESYESGLDSIRDYIKYLKELAGTGATDEIEFTLNRIGDYWGDILYQKHVTKPSPRARPATLRQFAETMQKKVDKLPQKDPRTAYLRPEVNPVTKKLKNTGRVVAALQKMIRKANEGESVLAPAATPGAGSDLEKDLQTLKAAAQKADAGRGTLRVTGGTKFGGGSITIVYSGLPNTPRGEGVAWDNGPHALIMIQGYDKDGNRTAKGTVEVLRVHPRKAPFRQRKGDLGTVVAVTAKQLPALFDALVAAGGAKEARARRTAAAEVNVRGDLLVYRDGGDGENVEQAEIPFNVTVPASDTYRSFIDRLQVALNEVADEPGYEVDLSSDVITDSDPLRLWLEAKQAPNHPATELFYDWVCSHYSWYDERDIEALSKRGGGFADTDFTWDYYESADQLVNEVGYVYESEPDLYTTDDDGNEILKSPEEQADYLWGIISNSNDVLEARQNELETGDYFVIRYA